MCKSYNAAEMNALLDTYTILVVCCLIHGFAALRLLKVSIPSYKLRGESVFLECQYELDKVRDMSLINSYSPNRDHEYDSQSDTWVISKRMHSYHSQEDTKKLRYQRHTYYQKDQQIKNDQQQIQRLYSYQQRKLPYHAQHYEQRIQKQNQPYHYQQSLSEQQISYQHAYYQTPSSSSYGHRNYRGRSSPPIHAIGGNRLEAINSYNSDTYGERHDDNIHSFGHIEADNSFAEYNEHFNEEEKEETEEEEEDYNEEEKGEALYAIKWYKDNEEFYRYVPKAKPPKTSYRVDGVQVIEEHSDSSRVLLKGLTINSTGLYRCEISAEAPNFSSVEAEGHMDVVYLPRDGPYIKGQQLQYQVGETLDLNCTSGKSHPSSHLQWFINEEAAHDELNLIRYNETIHRYGLITTTLGLQLTIETRHFHKGIMRVKCLASLSPMFWKSDKETVLQRRQRPGLIDNREAMLLVHSSAPNNYKNDDTTALFAVAFLVVLRSFL
uniref:Ig-like domain-containing protein n=1 Tax=Glossina brevipalpis TaxID=37001 RepID=A0A1A9WJ64_9MUSC